MFCRRWRGDYTDGMDSVRFGRVLGKGARAMAQTVVGAVDAASAPNPSARRPEVTGTEQPARVTPGKAAAEATREGVARPAERAARASVSVRETGRGLRRGGKQFGEAVWGPVVKLSGVLWLEVTGVFFGLFAMSAGVTAWRWREAWRPAAGDGGAHNHLLVAAGLTALFGYFCVSSFVRASRRGRGR